MSVSRNLSGMALVMLLIGNQAFADEYERALQIADRAVQRQKTLSSSRTALSGNFLRGIFGRTYKKGDRWRVAAIRIDSAQARKTFDAEQLKDRVSSPTVFTYEVVGVEGGLDSRISLRVKQSPRAGETAPDARVESLMLMLDERMQQVGKGYRLRGRVDAIPVSPDGIHSGMTPLELYPLDVPAFLTGDSRKAEKLPEIPAALRPLVKDLRIDLSRLVYFEQTDFFGRPVEAYWQQGDPWPFFVRTSQGVAVLLGREGA